MGILNVTPDSFSDGGRHLAHDDAVAAGRRMAADGADILDVGGESTRPGAEPVPAEEEVRRVVPVIRSLREALPTRISIDSRKPEVVRAAIEAGADVINDVEGLRRPEMLQVALETGCPVIAMHMRGQPQTMQRDTDYADVVAEVRESLESIARRAVSAGLPGDKIALDPGIGFGKSAEGNLSLLRSLRLFTRGPWPILIGASRKTFLGRVAAEEGAPLPQDPLPPDDRRAPSLAVAAWSALHDVWMLRVHDVRETVHVLRTLDAVRRAPVGPA